MPWFHALLGLEYRPSCALVKARGSQSHAEIVKEHFLIEIEKQYRLRGIVLVKQEHSRGQVSLIETCHLRDRNLF